MLTGGFKFQIEARKGMAFMSFLLVCSHMAIAFLGLIRHNMTVLVPGYKSFNDIFGTEVWSTIALAIGLGLLLLPRGSFLLIVWQFLSATYFAVFAILVSEPFGMIWGTIIWALPSIQSYIVMFFTAQDWIESKPFFHTAKDSLQTRLNRMKSNV